MQIVSPVYFSRNNIFFQRYALNRARQLTFYIYLIAFYRGLVTTDVPLLRTFASRRDIHTRMAAIVIVQANSCENAGQDRRYVEGGRLYTDDDRRKERKVLARVRKGERTRERRLNTDSTIPGRLAFHRQSGPSTTDRKVRVLSHPRAFSPPLLSHPFFSLSSLLCSFLVS